MLQLFEKGSSGNLSDIYKTCLRHYDYVRVEPNVGNDSFPFRLAIRCGGIKPECLYEIEAAGYSHEAGSTCNEWETSLNLKRDEGNARHPPHMKVDITPPELLEQTAPEWYRFLDGVRFLGELIGDLRPSKLQKLDFGECTTSIVLETYKHVYGSDYKTHQCDKCINAEIGFKNAIELHDFDKFQKDLNAFATHFEKDHAEELKNAKKVGMHKPRRKSTSEDIGDIQHKLQSLRSNEN